MAETTTVEDAIEVALTKPKSSQMGEFSSTQHSISDLIALDKHQSAKAARSSRSMGLRFGVFTPPGH